MTTADTLRTVDAREALESGLWVPISFGASFNVARLVTDRRAAQVDGERRYGTLAEARAECDTRNARLRVRVAW